MNGHPQEKTPFINKVNQELGQATAGSRLWRRPADPASVKEIAALPMAAILTSAERSEWNQKEAEALFQQKFMQIPKLLQEAKKSSVLVRSQSLPLAQRRSFMDKAKASFEKAKSLREDLNRLALRLDGKRRRALRALEGMQEWRKVGHVVSKNAELLAKKRDVA